MTPIPQSGTTLTPACDIRKLNKNQAHATFYQTTAINDTPISLFDFTTQSFESFLGLAAFIVSIATFAWTKEKRKEDERPRIAISLSQYNSTASDAFLIVRNYGGGAAKDIHVKNIGDDFALIPSDNGRKLFSELEFLQYGLHSLVPKEERVYFVTSTSKRFQELSAKNIALEISYRDERGKQYTEQSRLDFRSLSYFWPISH